MKRQDDEALPGDTSPGEDRRQELEEDGRTVLAVFRNTEDEGLFRVYFVDATYLEIAGPLAGWHEGLPPGTDEKFEPRDTGWIPASWNELPWPVRDRVQREEEEILSVHSEELAAELLSHPYAEQLALVAERSELHEWCLAHTLLEKSRIAVLSDPGQAADLIAVALRLSAYFNGYSPARVAELRARLLAHRGNALRVLGEFRSAGEAFREAGEYLASGETMVPDLVRAEILSLHASLLREERRFDEARRVLGEARALYERDGATYLVARVILKLSKTLEEEDAVEEALMLLAEAEPRLDPGDGRMRLCLKQNRLDFLTKLGRFEEASMLLPVVYRLATGPRAELDLLRLQWIEARIFCGTGQRDVGAALLDDVRRAFAERGMAYDAALVMLDLAVAYLDAGQMNAVARLAKDILPIFASREIHREAMMALLLFTEAAREGTLTVKLVRELAGHLRRERHSPRFTGPCAFLES